MEFNNKIAVVTGGANGIGLCIANEFARHGAKVAIVDIDKVAGERALQTILDNGGEGFFYCGDITEKSVLENFSNRNLIEYKFEKQLTIMVKYYKLYEKTYSFH